MTPRLETPTSGEEPLSGLSGKHRRRFATALTAFGFAEEAGRALSPRAGEEDGPQLLAGRATALAALGRFGEAEAAAGRALTLRPVFPEAEERLKLARLARKHLRGAAADWTVADRLMPVLLKLQARGPAAEMAVT